LAARLMRVRGTGEQYQHHDQHQPGAFHLLALLRLALAERVDAEFGMTVMRHGSRLLMCGPARQMASPFGAAGQPLMHTGEHHRHEEQGRYGGQQQAPITARPSGAFCSAPSPRPRAMGIMPMIMASAVISTGRIRVEPASSAAASGGRAVLQALPRKGDDQDAVGGGHAHGHDGAGQGRHRAWCR
jgi:hypothetical protein